MDAITENAAGYYYYQPVQSFMMHTAAAILFIVCSYISYIIFRVKNKYDAKYPPFAPGGMWNHMKMITSSEFPWWLLDVSKQLRTGGVFQLSLPVFPTKHFVVVGDPTVVRAISTDPTTLKPGAYKFLDVVSGGPTILSSNSQTWHAKRKAAAPAFSSNHIKRMTKVAADITETWVNDKLAVLSNNNGSFDVGREMILIILMALSETAFEYKMSKQEANLFIANLDIALVEFTRKSPGNPFRQSFFGRILPERRKAFHARDSTHGLICHIMAEYRRKKEKNSTTPGTIIELVMESDAFPTNQSKMAQLMEFLLAGHDTTAYTISWILICLANHPKEQAKLRASLVDLSTENWRNCEFLRNVIKEGMRLYPAARSGRMVGRDIMTSSGLIPKGSLCSLQFLLVFRNPDFFEEPDSYLPSRWENPTREMKDAFNPFSLGKQNCIGQSLAQAETNVIVARICSEFELSLECEGTTEFNPTLKPIGYRLKARKSIANGL